MCGLRAATVNSARDSLTPWTSWRCGWVTSEIKAEPGKIRLQAWSTGLHFWWSARYVKSRVLRARKPGVGLGGGDHPKIKWYHRRDSWLFEILWHISSHPPLFSLLGIVFAPFSLLGKIGCCFWSYCDAVSKASELLIGRWGWKIPVRILLLGTPVGVSDSLVRIWLWYSVWDWAGGEPVVLLDNPSGSFLLWHQSYIDHRAYLFLLQIDTLGLDFKCTI